MKYPPNERIYSHNLERHLRALHAKYPGDEDLDAIEKLLKRGGQMPIESRSDALDGVMDYEDPGHDPNDREPIWTLVDRYDSDDKDGKSRTDVERANGDPITATFQCGELVACAKWDGCIDFSTLYRHGPMSQPDKCELVRSYAFHACNLDGWTEALRQLRLVLAEHFPEAEAWDIEEPIDVHLVDDGIGRLEHPEMAVVAGQVCLVDRGMKLTTETSRPDYFRYLAAPDGSALDTTCLLCVPLHSHVQISLHAILNEAQQNAVLPPLRTDIALPGSTDIQIIEGERPVDFRRQFLIRNAMPLRGTLSRNESITYQMTCTAIEVSHLT